MIKFKRTLAIGLVLSLISTPLISHASNPEIKKSYYSIDKNTGKLKYDGSYHLSQQIDFDSDWHTMNIDGKLLSFKIKGITYNKSSSDNMPYTGINRIYSIANGQTLQNSVSSTIINKKGTILNKQSSGKISASAGLSIGKFLNFKNKLSKTWNTSITSTNIEESNETSTISDTYSFYNTLKGKGYNSLDFYTVTAYDVYDVDVDLIEHNGDTIVSTQCQFNANATSVFCRECGSTIKTNGILLPYDEGDLTLAHVKTQSSTGTSNTYHIGYPSNESPITYLRKHTSRVIVDGVETILPINVTNMKLEYLTPYEIKFSSPWKLSDSITQSGDSKIQLVAPGTQKLIENNGEKYLLTIKDSKLLSRSSLPDETLPPLRFSIANGQSVNKELSSTLTKTSSLEKVSGISYNFSTGLSGSLFKILSFEAGYDKNLSGSLTTNISQTVSISVSGKNSYFFPEEFSNQGNSLIFNTTNDFAEFLITAQATPINSDGSFNTNQTINMTFKYKQPFIKNYSLPSNF